ncbi:hypothetical protein PPH41_39100 [Burkholderia gladioli]|nr:hypothetical protein [Burkholderia gladioli]
MSTFTGHTFGPADTVVLDGNEFDTCTFEGCVVVFGGGPFAAIKCNWRGPQFRLVAHAQGTLDFVRAIGTLNGGVQFVDEVVAYLRGSDNPELVPTVDSSPFNTTRH